MSSFDYPLPEDWEDLPEQVKEQVPRELWPRLRQGVLRVRRIDETLARVTEEMTKAGVENDRMEELAPMLDSLRRARAVFDRTKTGEAANMGRALAESLQDVTLEANAVMGEMSIRNKRVTALVCDHWASLPQETLPPDLQAQVKEWLGGMREQILSELPLEVRKEVEEQDRRNRGE